MVNKHSKLLSELKGKAASDLTKRGNGVYLENLCIMGGLSPYGTNKDKTLRLLKWYKNNI